MKKYLFTFTLAEVLKIFPRPLRERVRVRGFKFAFTLAEVLIAIAIVGVIAGLVLPTTISRAQNRGFEQSYSRNVQTMEDAVNALIVSENKDFFKSVMYSDTTPSSYDNTSGEFIKKYLKVSRYCGSGTANAKLCFPSTYFRYNGNTKEIYNPNFAGACAKLKNGASICLQPQIGATGAKGIIDLNGPSGPNVLNRDLREFSLISKIRAGKDKTQDSVAVTLAPDLGTAVVKECGVDPNSWDVDCCKQNLDQIVAYAPYYPCCTKYAAIRTLVPTCEITPPTPPSDPCTTDPNGLACCQKKTITSSTDICCTYTSIFNANSKCDYCNEISEAKRIAGVGCVYNNPNNMVYNKAKNSSPDSRLTLPDKNTLVNICKNNRNVLIFNGDCAYKWTSSFDSGYGWVVMRPDCSTFHHGLPDHNGACDFYATYIGK